MESLLTTWNQLFDELLAKLQDVEKHYKEIIAVSKKSFNVCKEILDIVKNKFLHQSFSKEDEIDFFKNVKPRFAGILIYYLKVYNIELRRPKGDKEIVLNYLKKEIQKVNYFYDSYADLFQYIRSGETDKDYIYFTRGQMPSLIFLNSHFLEYDPQFSSPFDGLLSEMIANDKLLNYLQLAIYQLDKEKMPENKVTSESGSTPKWTDSKTDLIELAYSIKSKGSLDNGKASTEQIINSLEQAFSIDLGNHSRTFQEILSRKTGYTLGLDSLKESLIKFIDKLQERHRPKK
jgi:hypothetical protein